MVGTGLEWELQRAIHHLPLGRRLHCVVGMGASGRSKRNGDLARMASGVVAAGKYRICLFITYAFVDSIEYADDGVDEMDDGGDAVEAARRTLFDTDRQIVSLVLNGHRVLVQH